MALSTILDHTRRPSLLVTPDAISAQADIPKVADRTMEKAVEGAVRAYGLGHYPYSMSSRRGAALITANEEIFVGAHLQNAAEKPTIDPVSAALYAAITAGHRAFKGLVICGADSKLSGSVADQLKEFMSRIQVVHINPTRDSLSQRSEIFGSLACGNPEYRHPFASEIEDLLEVGRELLFHPKAHLNFDTPRLLANLSRLSNINFAHAYETIIAPENDSITEQQFLAAVYTAFLSASQAYTVRTGYSVGAAILGDGCIVGGCNSESTLYESLFACAETAAVATYASHGIGVRVKEDGHAYFAKEPELVVVATPTAARTYNDLVTPCGGCGSRISELGNPMVVSVSLSGLIQVSTQLTGTDGNVYRAMYMDGEKTSGKEMGGITYFPFLFNRQHLGGVISPNKGLETSGPFTASDLPRGPKGEHYHIGLSPEMVSPDILICGDPNRVKEIAKALLVTTEHKSDNRGLAFRTGITKEGRRITIASHGMGEGNTEIVVQELLAALSIDPQTGKMKQDFEIPKATIIRIGTSGGLQGDVPLGSAIITDVAFGVGSLGSFYQGPLPDRDLQMYEDELYKQLNGAATEQLSSNSLVKRASRTIPVYAMRCDAELIDSMKRAAEEMDAPYTVGMTYSAPGFFGPQGRDIGLAAPTVPDVDLLLKEMRAFQGSKFQNAEMEAATIALLAQGHRVGCVCVAIANRREDTFDSNYKESIARATEIAYRALLAFPRY